MAIRLAQGHARAELHKTIWWTTNDVRGSVDDRLERLVGHHRAQAHGKCTGHPGPGA
jgi:hypothetical protein